MNIIGYIFNAHNFIYNLFGKFVGDKGYISKDLFDKLFVDGIQLIKKLKKNMKGCTMSIADDNNC